MKKSEDNIFGLRRNLYPRPGTISIHALTKELTRLQSPPTRILPSQKNKETFSLLINEFAIVTHNQKTSIYIHT